MNNEIISKAGAIAQKVANATIAVVNENGYPRASTISNIKADGIETIWFATGLDSGKVKCLSKNAKASICYNLEGNNVTLIGEIDIFTDPETKRLLWVDWFINHFPNGPEDSNYCILKFKAHECVYWIDQQYGEVTLAES